MADGPDGLSRDQESAEVFGLLARVVHRTAQDAAALLRAEGLNPAQFQLLRAVGAAPGSVQAELGERLGVTSANVSMLVAKLEAAGLVSRVPIGAAKGITLTAAGDALVTRLEPDQGRFLAGRFTPLTDDELHTLRRLMSAVLEGLPTVR